MFEKVQGLIADHLMIDKSKVTENAKFVEDLGADSLDIIQMIMQMEDEFGFKFEDEEMSTIKTVGDAVKLIEQKK